MIKQKLKLKILKKAISLEKFDLFDLAWTKSDAIELIESLMNDEIGILGGDVWIFESDSLTPAYDNWYSNYEEGETCPEFYLRSKKRSIAYIKSYPEHCLKNKVFSMVFTEDVYPEPEESNRSKKYEGFYRMHKNNDTLFNCRVCGLNQDFEPWGEDGESPTFDICGCCGVEFGYGDCNLNAIYASRAKWLENNAAWSCPNEKPPNWSLEEQMKGTPPRFK
jgi:hypothetical protein